MNNAFQEHFGRFVADFSAIANRQRPDESLTIDLVRSALVKRPKEEEAAYSDRCRRMLNAYSYVAKNAAAFRNIQALVYLDDGPRIEGKLLAVLYLFFMATDLYLAEDPRLDRVLDALVKEERK
jgi:hypothetical protein